MALYTHTIQPASGSRKNRKIRGRGNASGHGNYSGHGGKGQTARSGGSKGMNMKGFKFLLQSTPKLRGFTSLNKKASEVYLNELDKHFADGETVSLATLKEKKIIAQSAKNAKIVSTGELTKKLNIDGVSATAKAKEKVVAAGGSIK